jgi:Family of unknown function (DUF6527)
VDLVLGRSTPGRINLLSEVDLAMKFAKSETGEYLFFCPGCQCNHSIWPRPSSNPENGASWEFDGNVDRPTVSPSLLVKRHFTAPDRRDQICHSFITDGNIRFLGDSTHALAGQTLEIPDYD